MTSDDQTISMQGIAGTNNSSQIAGTGRTIKGHNQHLRLDRDTRQIILRHRYQGHQLRRLTLITEFSEEVLWQLVEGFSLRITQEVACPIRELALTRIEQCSNMPV